MDQPRGHVGVPSSSWSSAEAAKALSRATELDGHMRVFNKPVGPLHGLPISVKEHIGMKGLPCNAGYVAWANHIPADDALILKILWEAGCVFFVRTTEPQTLMHLETSSNLYGCTVNPYNTDLTSGGSSGGEGALLALRGSCLGIGSDIGGSIRSPAAHNEIYGLRPTSHRLPKIGSFSAANGGDYIAGTLGPLSTSLEGIDIFMKVVLASKPWTIDPSLVPIAWRNDRRQAQEYEEYDAFDLKIAVMWTDDIVTPHPSVRRALEMMVKELKTMQDIEVVDWTPYEHKRAWEIIAGLYYVDGGKNTTDLLAATHEPWRPLSEFIITDNPHVKDLTRGDIQELIESMENYRLEYAKKWNETAPALAGKAQSQNAVDVILCPATPGPAPWLNGSKYWGYTSQWNLLDYPALVFPVTKFDSVLDQWPGNYKPRNDQDRYNFNLCTSGFHWQRDFSRSTNPWARSSRRGVRRHTHLIAIGRKKV
ncbi:MAG: hypothetical protein Q9207_005923 [Kuettlingeria erythrocarpa]